MKKLESRVVPTLSIVVDIVPKEKLQRQYGHPVDSTVREAPSHAPNVHRWSIRVAKKSWIISLNGVPVICTS